MRAGGKTVRIFVGYGPGSGYDVYARLIGRHFAKHLAGQPNVIVQNMPGAASLTMANNLYNIAPRDAYVTEKLKKAGAIVVAKVTLGEMGGGDTYGSLFGVSRNPYDPERTVDGSSGGTGAAVSANFATVGVGQEGFASIRRPARWAPRRSTTIRAASPARHAPARRSCPSRTGPLCAGERR